MRAIRTTTIDGEVYEVTPVTIDDDGDIAKDVRLFGEHLAVRPLGRFHRTISFVEAQS